ncbi:MAG: hypothetical protein IJV49_04105 [Aeriscardovia sp.]|nr:hypothetical protein [Aeriscardovia sp.]
MAISYAYVCCRGQIDFGPVAKNAVDGIFFNSLCSDLVGPFYHGLLWL